MNIFVTIILLFSLNSHAFFNLFEGEITSEKPNPFLLETEKEQMEYLDKYDPQTAYWIREYRKIFQNIKTLDLKYEKEFDEEWEYYSKYEAQILDESKIREKKEMEKQREKKRLLEKTKRLEKKILSQYMFVDGKLVNKKEYEAKKQEEKDNKRLREEIIKFQKEEGLPVLKDGERIKVKME